MNKTFSASVLAVALTACGGPEPATPTSATMAAEPTVPAASSVNSASAGAASQQSQPASVDVDGYRSASAVVQQWSYEQQGQLLVMATQQAIRDTFPQLAQCYENRSRPSSASILFGVLKLRIEVAADGSVTSVAEDGDEFTKLNGPMTQCMLGVVQKVKFPKPVQGSATIKLGIGFRPLATSTK